MKLLLFTLLVYLAYANLGVPVYAPAHAGEDQSKVVTVHVMKVKLTELSDILHYPARIVPKVNTTVLSEIDGVVARIVAPLGHQVKNRGKIMILNHTDPVYQYAPVMVLSPVPGTVSLIEVTEGSHVTKGQRLASVTDPAKIHIAIEVPAQDLHFLSKGMKGTLKISGQEGEFPLEVRGISPFVDPATGTATAELELLHRGVKSQILRPGLMGQVTFKTNIRMGISIPDHSVLYKGSETFVRLLEGGKAKNVTVQLGKKQRGFVEVISGLQPDQVMIERSSRFLADGEAVSVESEGK